MKMIEKGTAIKGTASAADADASLLLPSSPIIPAPAHSVSRSASIARMKEGVWSNGGEGLRRKTKTGARVERAREDAREAGEEKTGGRERREERRIVMRVRVRVRGAGVEGKNGAKTCASDKKLTASTPPDAPRTQSSSRVRG